MDIIEILKTGYCCGCGACAAICPQKAIDITLNDSGFFYPVLNEIACNNCGLCTKVGHCTLDEKELTDFNKCNKYYAFSKNPEIVLKSSSGGVAFEFGRYARQNGLKVIGTLYDYKTNRAVTSIAETIEQIEQFQGSKYIQADSADAIRRALHSKDHYVVIGTPCQIYELWRAAKLLKQSDRFIFIDFVCHGVPSAKVWNRYLEDKSKLNHNEYPENISFRCKEYGWHKKAMKIVFPGGSLIISSKNDDFYKIYYDCYLLNDACYHCKINNGRGVSDIRVGDCWGERFINNPYGVSRVVVATEKGTRLFNNAKNVLEYDDLPELVFLKDNRETFKPCCDRPYIKPYALKQIDKGYSLKKVIKLYRKRLPLRTRLSYLTPDSIRKVWDAIHSITPNK